MQHLLGHTGRIFAHFGDGDVTLGDVQTRALNLRLKSSQLPKILAEDHKTRVGLRSENGRGDDLHADGASFVNGLSNRARVHVTGGVTKEVHDVQST